MFLSQSVAKSLTEIRSVVAELQLKVLHRSWVIFSLSFNWKSASGIASKLQQGVHMKPSISWLLQDGFCSNKAHFDHKELKFMIV